MSFNHVSIMLWLLDTCDERIQRFGSMKLPSGIRRLASATTLLMPLLALYTIIAISFPAMSLPCWNRNVCNGAAMLLHQSGAATITMS